MNFWIVRVLRKVRLSVTPYRGQATPTRYYAWPLPEMGFFSLGHRYLLRQCNMDRDYQVRSTTLNDLSG